MEILIDNKDITTVYGITVLDYTGLLTIPAERLNERVWQDKSGVERLITNKRSEANEFVLVCYVKENTAMEAYAKIKTLTDYMFSKGLFVLSLRDTATSIRECYLCERSAAIVGEVNVRYQNSVYAFKLGLKDINPRALKFKNTLVDFSTSIAYTKGQNAPIFWGDGSIGNVSNSGTYLKEDYVAETGKVDIIVDVDADTSTVGVLTASFTTAVHSGIVPDDVSFTDTSTGTPVIWAWDFGDGNTSDLQSPSHTYETDGSFTVTLQIFNSVGGSAIETKTNNVVVRHAIVLLNDDPTNILINSTNNLNKN